MSGRVYIGNPKTRVEWSDAKNRLNRLKHKVRFEDAYYALFDPFRLTEQDFSSDFEERCRTIGMNKRHDLMVVVYTVDEAEDGTELIRIISARFAGPQERTIYGDRKF
jgi:uncharacterized DUF497 family protein